ncbi:lysylphosphatidylglycerol synthase transmembrane domain-containing protein [Halonatronum saccharophilum]|uniref:lysylphosphatidylglycerol synthase transmembrane domain-containing protein n=1 Tax=Halonatronum saccharophilum TaxID=150060 RepID=UPI000480CD7E|nr:lysylphosphatidylglycerol synthase transmembrane domain-containing protein [Halonatronum saccharophilum]
MVAKKAFLLVLGIIVLTLMVIYFGADEVLGTLKGINPLIILALALFQFGTIILTAYQWHYLLSKEKRVEISFFKFLRINLAATFVESVTPSSKLGGEAAKIYLLKEDTGVSYNRLTTLTLVHKYISLLPFLLISGVVLFISLFQFTLPAIVYLGFIIILISFTLLIGLSMVIWSKEEYSNLLKGYNGNKIIEFLLAKIDNGYCFLFNAIKETRGIINKGEQLYLLFISLLVWGLYPVKIYLAAWILGFEITLILAAIATYAAYLVSMLPLLPGGLGSFEGTMGAIFSLNGLLFTQGLAIALLTRLITFWLPLLISAGATIYLILVDKLSLSWKSSNSKVESQGVV